MKKDRKSIKNAVSKYNEECDAENSLKNKEYKKRRESKKQRQKKILSDRRIQCFRLLYIPTLTCLISGCIFTLLSTTRSIGEGTFLWTYKHIFHIIGPALLGSGMIMLLVTVGLLGEREKLVKKNLSREASARSKSVSRKSSMASLPMSICHSIDDLLEPEVCQSIDELSVAEPSVCQSIDKLSETNPAVDFTKTLAVPESNFHKIKRRSSSSSVSFSDAVNICENGVVFSQSLNEGVKLGGKEPVLRISQSIDVLTTSFINSAENENLPKPKSKKDRQMTINNSVGVRIVSQRPAVGEEEPLCLNNTLRNGNGPTRNGFKRNEFKRQNAVLENSDEEEIWIERT